MVAKKDLVALSKGGSVAVHKGKSAAPAQTLSTHNNVKASGSNSPGAGINNYSKATPAAQPTPPSPDGLGSGTWPGIGE